jgi:hypothetical protein
LSPNCPQTFLTTTFSSIFDNSLHLPRKTTDIQQNPRPSIMPRARRTRSTNGPQPDCPDTLRPGHRCLFFELPREIRDMIYKLALAHQDGIVTSAAHLPRGSFRIVPRSTEEAGPRVCDELQFVCRQMRRETTGILFDVNSAIFHGEYDDMCSQAQDATSSSVVSGLDHFMNFWSTSQFATRLEKVIIYFGKIVDRRSLDTIFNLLDDTSHLSTLCRSHPKVTIIIRFRWILTNMFIRPLAIVTDFLHHQLRGSHLHVIPGMCWQTHVYFWHLRSKVMASANKIHLPNNLRISVMHALDFQESPSISFREDLLETLPQGSFTDPQIDEMIGVVKKTLEEGF